MRAGRATIPPGARRRVCCDCWRSQAEHSPQPSVDVAHEVIGEQADGAFESSLSTVTSPVTLTTESRGSTQVTAGRDTWPGIAASQVLDVMTQPRVVRTRLAL